jgi:hypothetical protein
MSKTSQRKQSYFDLGRKEAGRYGTAPKKPRWINRRDYNLGVMQGIKEAENRVSKEPT